MDYEIYTDVSADIPDEIVNKYNIKYISMSYDIGDQTICYRKRESDEFIKDFYNQEREGKVVRSTQINPEHYINIFESELSRGKSVLYLALSGGLSNTYNSSLIAASEVNEKYTNAKVVCFNSLSTTAGLGILIERAIYNRENGLNIDENFKNLEEFRKNIAHWFMVDDLMFLKRGGRIPAGTAIIGKIANIKPILTVLSDGTLGTLYKKIGTKAALNEMIKNYQETRVGGDGERVYIIHADAIDKANYLLDSVKKINPSANVSVMLLSPIIGVHVGPGMCGLLHVRKG